MIETMRWFGPRDPVSLRDIRQSGATGVVTALLDTPIDQAWSSDAVIARRDEIDAAGLRWQVVEAIPVHESIKLAANDADRHVEIWLQSLRAVAAAGIRTVCYNFMPVLDWTRTDLHFPLPDGATALRFDFTALAAFDLFILGRAGAEHDYDPLRIEAARKLFARMSADEVAALTRSIIAGLPGCTGESYDLDSFTRASSAYREVDGKTLLANLIAFQKAVVPVAESLGVVLAIHPDDPPRPLLGLPRTVSSRADFQAMFSAVPARANGLTWCLGSLAAAPSQEALDIGRDHAERIHFAHLRTVTKDPDDRDSFQEAAHLEGDVSLVEAVALLRAEEARRMADGEERAIPMRPDHGHQLTGEPRREANPGYGFYGRLKGMAELRGVSAGLAHA